MRVGRQKALAFRQQYADGRFRSLNAQAQIGQEGLGENRRRHRESGLRDDRTDGVGQDVAEDEGTVPRAHRAGSQHILVVLIAVELRANHATHADPAGDNHNEDERRHACAQEQNEQNRHDLEGNAAQHLDHTLHEHIHFAAVVARDGAIHNADEAVDHHRAETDQKGNARTAPHADPQVAADVIGTKPEVVIAGVLEDVLVDLDACHRNFLLAVIPGVLFKDLHQAALLLILGELGLLNLVDLGAVTNAELLQHRDTRRKHAEAGMHLAVAIAREHRRKNRHQHDEDDDDRRKDGRLVLLKAQPRIHEEADRLAFKLLVVQLAVGLHKLEVFSRQLAIMIITHGSYLLQCGYAGRQCRSSGPSPARW